MKVCQERILNSSTTKLLWIAENCKEVKFIMLKHYYKLDKNQMNKQEMQQLVNSFLILPSAIFYTLLLQSIKHGTRQY